MFSDTERNRQLFYRLTNRPVLVLALAFLFIVATGAGLTRLVKDTSVKAFMPAGHPSLVAEQKAAEIFGLSDTIAIALLTRDGSTVFTPGTLSVIADLSDRLQDLPNINFLRIASLATESSISGDGGTVFVDAYIDLNDMSAASVAASEQRWRAMTPHRGTLVSEDGTGAAIVAELHDLAAADATYLSILEMVEAVEAPGLELHVAGPGAVSGFLSRYIDEDARKLQPLVFVLVLAFIYLAFRSVRALPGPLFVVIGSAAGSLGLMAFGGVPYFAITNALPVIIVAISVADSIHVLSTCYQLREQDGEAAVRDLVVRSMAAMARPITLTTLTTIAGFAGIAAVSIMPPITWFALYAALGVALAWVFSIVALPNMLLIVKPGRSPAFANWHDNKPSGTGRFLAHLGTFSPVRYRSVLVLFALATVIAIIGASKLRIDRSQVDNFAADEPIRVADEVINERFAGTAFLDVVVETDETGGLLSIDRMRKIRSLQSYFEGLPHVQKTVSIVDYLSELHLAIEGSNADGDTERPLPDSNDAVAQFLFVYEVSGDPTDLEEEIDGDYRTALVRGVLNAHHFSENRATVESLDTYLRESFNEPGMRATLAGDVNVSYHWMASLSNSHFQGVALSLALVLATSILVFRSAGAGIVSVVPVVFTVLVLYACMGWLGIYLEPATSMFAAIALGVGVDFAIHLVDRLRSATKDRGGDIAGAIDEALPPVARACLFNSAALGVGFSALLISDLPTLKRFGGLVMVAAFSSYLVALIIVPALFAACHAWLGRGLAFRRRVQVPASLLLIAVIVIAVASDYAGAAMNDADRIAANVASRVEGNATRRVIEMTLTNKRNRREERVAIVHKRNDGDVRQTRITFQAPKKSRDVTFLSYDHRNPSVTDERWMYTPVTRRVRRIPASQRGKAFLGTDFSYEDMQSELKFSLDDWAFEYAGQSDEDGRPRHRITGTPKSARIGRELGYGAFSAVVDEESWMPVLIEFYDVRQRPLKDIEVRSIDRVDGIWTARDIVATNHQTWHRTRFVFRDVEYLPNLPDRLFDAQALARGLASSDGE